VVFSLASLNNTDHPLGRSIYLKQGVSMAEPFDSLYKLQKQDTAKAAETFADAFSEDPVWNAIFSEIRNDHRRICATYESPVLYCLRYGSVYAISKRLEGVAAWVPGEVSNFTFWRMLRSGGLGAGMKIGFKIAKKMMPIFKPIEEDRKKHMAGKEYIYLQILGVARKFQKRGLGGKLLRAVIAESEQTRKALYIETETEENVTMYKHFGFEVIQKIELPLITLPMWEMVRNV